MAVVRLALLSLWNRRLTALLAILAITLSVTLFLGVERVRIGAKSSFADTISGTDLIVGARAGDVQLPALFHLPHQQRHAQHHHAEPRRHPRPA